MARRRPDPGFWRKQHVFLTGHTGFKGAWACLLLERLGARVTGLALAPETTPSLFEKLAPSLKAQSVIADIRDLAVLKGKLEEAAPTLLFHMAAQSLVRKSYKEPLATVATNVQGTANLLDAARELSGLKAILVVTSDKVYENSETGRAFDEADPLGGHDLYAASKAAADIVTSAYARSFFAERNIPVATARAGNVIGGGDFSADRLIPDIWRAARKRERVRLRYPNATRPWQHVLDCLAGYLIYLEDLASGARLPPALNFGPDLGEPRLSVGEVAARIQGALMGDVVPDIDASEQPREMSALGLDNSNARSALRWQPIWGVDEAIRRTAAWYQAFDRGNDPLGVSRGDIDAFLEAQ